MNKILAFVVTMLTCLGEVFGAVGRDAVPVRQGSSMQRVVSNERGTGGRSTTILNSGRGTSARVAARVAYENQSARSSGQSGANVVSRAAVATSPVMETQTGLQYEKCKTAYFTCMDQFCGLKNDDYRRCSCSKRVDGLAEQISALQDAGNQLTTFTENLDVVGMTAAQASAMHTASDGEQALADDTSASKAILQAIMNSIRGDKVNVTGKYSPLNSLDFSFDTINAFGTSDVGQVVAAYDGQNLYNAVYPQCRQVVRADCNDASLQRAVNAYLMAIEQDCNTVQTAIESKQTELKAALREGSAMLDLARIENRQNHNSNDFTDCINAVEVAIKSEEVCGENYHRCLDNGEYIDIATGAPIEGVVDFYKLATMLTFNDNKDIENQKLSKVFSNRSFVSIFEKRVKKFAEPALDKCAENADDVWSEYLDKALLDIYYAQQDKVAEIKQGCFDFVSGCYMNGDSAITAAMKGLVGQESVLVQPDVIVLNGALCSNYVESCDRMFRDSGDENQGIIAQYIQERQDADVLTACRAIVKQCFDSYGGTNYENFYYPYSGIFDSGEALNWFTLYDDTKGLVSDCAKQLKTVSACANEKIIEKAFGGLDRRESEDKRKYGFVNNDSIVEFVARSSGVATEIYNQVLSILVANCENLGGVFSQIGGECSDSECATDNYGNSVDVKSWGSCKKTAEKTTE